jgi:hypothetical protein
MKNRIGLNEIIGTLVVGLIILISGWYVYDLQYLSKTELTTIGLPYEAGTIASLQAITELHQKHPLRTKLQYIPPFTVENDELIIPEAFQVPEQLVETTIQEGVFLQELVSNSPLQAHEYLLARESNRDTIDWQSLALYVDENLLNLVNDIEENLDEYAEKYEEDYNFSTTFIKEQNIQNPSIAATLLNGEIHNLGTTPTTYTLRTSLTKDKLRQGEDIFGEEAPVRLFGQEFASAAPQFEGFNEAYQEIDCNDRTNAYGSLQDSGSVYSRCEYTQAEPLDIKIVYYEDYDPQQDSEATGEQAEQVVNRFLQANFKSLEISEWREQDYGRDIESTKSENGFPPFSVLIDEEVRNTPAFDLFVEQNILLQLSEDKYYLNTEQILQF